MSSIWVFKQITETVSESLILPAFNYTYLHEIRILLQIIWWSNVQTLQSVQLMRVVVHKFICLRNLKIFYKRRKLGYLLNVKDEISNRLYGSFRRIRFANDQDRLIPGMASTYLLVQGRWDIATSPHVDVIK